MRRKGRGGDETVEVEEGVRGGAGKKGSAEREKDKGRGISRI